MNGSGPSAVIFGASGSVGSALARRLARSGWRLFLVSRDAASIPLPGTADSVTVRSAQATNPADVESCLQEASDRYGGLAAVANCVGNLVLKPAHLTDDATWHETLLVHLTSSFLILRSAVKRMMNTGGSLVFVSSAAAATGFANHEAIAAAKAGIEGLVRSAAATYGPRKIRVNAVAPGLLSSHMTRSLIENESARAASESMHILGRLGEPDDVAAALEWLMGPASSWVTGQILGVDGGLAHVRPRPPSIRAPAGRS